MNRTEKAYFKKFGFKYIKEIKPEIELFNLINKQLNKQAIDPDIDLTIKNYIEEAYPKINFTRLKNNLFKRLLDSLSEYDKKDDNRALLMMQYNEANVLLKRNLAKDALKIINSAKDNIILNEDSILGVMFEELGFKCAVVLNDKEKIKESYTSRYAFLNELKSQLHLNELYEDSYHLFRTKGVDREGEITKDLQRITTQVETFNLENKSYKFKFNYYSLLKLIAYLKNENKNVITALEKMVHLIHEAPQMFQQKDRIVIGTYADLIIHGIESNNSHYFYKYFDIIAHWESAQQDIINYAKIQTLRSKIALLSLEQKYNEVILLEEDYLNYKEDFNQLLQLAINDCFILSFYCLKDYKKVIQYANYQFEIKDLRMDIQLTAEFILLIIYFEENNFDVLQNSIKSIENRMKNKADSILKNEKTILSFFKNSVSSKQIPVQEMAEKCLKDLKSNKYEALSNSFDFIVWFDSIVNKTTYSNILKVH